MSSSWALILGSLLVLSACSTGDARPEPVPPVPEDLLVSSELREHGQTLFLKHCALCHGVRGDGHGVRRRLSKPAVDLTDAMWRQQASAEGVYLAIRDGIPRSPMAAWKVLSEEQIWALTAHVLRLSEEGV